jgi:hypothetical protein
MTVDLEVGKSEDGGYSPDSNLTDLLDHEFQGLSRFVNLGLQTYKVKLKALS